MKTEDSFKVKCEQCQELLSSKLDRICGHPQNIAETQFRSPFADQM